MAELGLTQLIHKRIGFPIFYMLDPSLMDYAFSIDVTIRHALIQYTFFWVLVPTIIEIVI